MTPERWRQLTELFHAVLERQDASARAALLDERCAGDPELRAEVEAMLGAHRAAGSFLETPALPPEQSDPAPGEALDALFEEPGRPGPRYRLVRRIGQGGMGVVFEAEQQYPVRRVVALKLVRAGLDTEAVLGRFQSELQASALMSHPNIAAVHEAGATRDGRPYFVMELVRGQPLGEFCDQERLTVRARLELFAQVCDGVQHAHQKGVIHRDLKPSNILVARHDGRPVPKIIDFGIAKATSAVPGERAASRTEAGMLIGTPAYMSPEQVALTAQDVDTRTDIYALGVVLHELLVGVHPFEGRLETAGFDEIRRIIREEDPPPPSSKTLQASPEVTAARSTDASHLFRQVKGDADWIVLKALAKEPARRYDSASAMATDVRRHLEDLPIQARAPSRRYALGKFVRRHRIGVTAGLLIALALVSGIALATVGLVRARRAEREARAAAAQATAINEFLRDTLGSADPLRGQGRDVTVREALRGAAQKAEAAFRDHPETLAGVLNTVGLTHLTLGNFDEARTLITRALEIRRKGPVTSPLALGESLSSMGSLLIGTGDFAGAERMYREALEVYRAGVGGRTLEVATGLNNLGLIMQRTGQNYAAALPLLEESLAIRTQLLGEHDRSVAQSLNNVAMCHYRMDQLDRAEPLFRKAVALDRELLGPRHPEVATNLHNLALVLRGKGAFLEAEKIFLEVLEMDRERLGEDHPDVAHTEFELAKLLLQSGRVDDAEARFQRSLAIASKSFPPDHWEIAIRRSGLGACLVEKGEYAAAETMLLEALSTIRKSFGDDHAPTQATLKRVVHLYERAGNPEKAASYRKLLRYPLTRQW